MANLLMFYKAFKRKQRPVARIHDMVHREREMYHECKARVETLEKLNAQLLAACKTASARVDEYYEQENYDEKPLFKATEVLLAAIDAAEEVV